MREEEKNKTRDSYQSSFRFDKRSILSVHFIVKTTGITEIMTISISPPQWSGSGPAVDTLSTLCKEKSNEETAIVCITMLASIKLCFIYKVILLLFWLEYNNIECYNPLCAGYSALIVLVSVGRGNFD